MRNRLAARHALAFVLGSEQPRTQTSVKERDALRACAQGKKRAVEIGVFEGFNTALIAGALEEGGVLFAVDPFFTGRLRICWSEVVARLHIRREGLTDRVRFIKALSWEATKQIEGAFDFIFVDGDHSWEGIARDWRDWSPRLEASGLIALHDTCWSGARKGAARLDSYRFYEEVIQHNDRFELVDQVDSLTVLRHR